MPDFIRPLGLQSPLMRGADVLAAQRALRSLGAPDLEPDGLYGPGTASAVQAFRRQQRLPDGNMLDQQAWSLLFAAPASATPTSDLAQLVDRLSVPQQFRDSVTWLLGPAGIAVSGQPAIGTPGEPQTVRRILSNYGAAIADSCKRCRIPAELIIATIAVESSGLADARREEPGWTSDSQTPDKVSVGLMQTLLSTARAAMNKSDIDAAWLINPANSIDAGAAYIEQQLGLTGYDPPKVGCAYNAGGLYYDPSSTNRWRMRQYPIGTSVYADKLIAFFNDALAVLRPNPGILDAPSFAAEFARRDAGTAALDPLIEKLGLNPVAKRAAYQLKSKHPEVVFTSGRRSKEDQARAMSQNIPGRRNWIAEVYLPNTASRACQAWVTAHPEADTPPAIAAGLLSVLNSLSDADVAQLSRHLTGNAFDVQPIQPDPNGVEVSIRALAGLKTFLNNEGGLVRWHAEFNA